jgi:hypothetical protein
VLLYAYLLITDVHTPDYFYIPLYSIEAFDFVVKQSCAHLYHQLTAKDDAMKRFISRILALCLLLGASSSAFSQNVPGAFMVRVYSEALGRAPDPTGWSSAVNYFQVNGCSTFGLKEFARPTFLSSEYASRGYDNSERVVTLYRALLGREPDAGGFYFWRGHLDSGTPFATIVEAFLGSAEFSAYITSSNGACKKYLSWGGQPALTGIETGSGFVGTQAQLQQQLNATQAGGTIQLAQRAVVQLTSTLTIPAGVRLITSGSPGPTQYAKQARLVRSTAFQGPMVDIVSGGILESVWVSGQRPAVGYNFTGGGNESGNVRLLGGSGTKALNNRTDTPAGWTTLSLWGQVEGFPCASATVSGNLSLGYGSAPYSSDVTPFSPPKTWADGISNACENAVITSNTVIDATDVGIVVFQSSPAVQRSYVASNTVVAGGVPAIAALGIEACTGACSGVVPFSGSSIEYNTFWAAPAQYYVIGLAVGSRSWHVKDDFSASGLRFVGNTSAGIATPMQVGILIDGATQSVVQSNNLLRLPLASPPNGNRCANGNIVANANTSFANGSFQGPIDNQALVSGCL